MTDAGTRRRLSVVLRIAGAALMLAAEACVVLMLFGGETVLCLVLAVVLMSIGVVVWTRGWHLGR